MDYDSELSEDSLQSLFVWIDGIPLSRKKKNISRDFSDGLLVAEIIAHYFPRLVEIHNYVSASSINQKLNNWGTLNRKVLSKLHCTVPADIMRKIAECSPGIIEVFLLGLLRKIESRLMNNRQSTQGNTPESRPYYIARSSENVSQGLRAEATDVGTSISSLQTDYAVKNPIPLAQLDLGSLDNQTRLILEEKEQALLASQETVQILQVKIRRLEHLLHLKDLRLQDMEQRLTRFDSVSSIQSSAQRR
ncbi:sperm flagellar protein 1-like isoform X1 [Clavelina lepadiformis]|uniref:sperm flagellar protein 1-like isoform X1 n=1 Tax=Clavelina lepadiformis TaxID=159417 RepID=UPI0040413E9B